MAVSLPSARHRRRVCAVAGVVDVWRVDLSGAACDGPSELLCAQERARAARIVHAHKRRLWARSRGVLRELLGHYLDADPSELRFAPGPHGKPSLRSEPHETSQDGESGAGEDLRFNLSHSGELMLVAVTAAREVGVDVEPARERYTAEFLRTWTMREATVKCLGTGLAAAGLAAAGRTAAPLADDDALEKMWTAELDVGPRAFAAIAVAGAEVCELYGRDWPG